MIRLLLMLRWLFHGFQVFSKTPLIVGLIPDYFLKKKYWKQLKERCASMGLAHRESSYLKDFGSLHGTVNGYRIDITVISDYTAATGTHIAVAPRCRKNIASLELERTKPVSRPEEWQRDFTTANSGFNCIFRTRRGDEATVNTLSGAPELLDRFVLFYARWMFRCGDFRVDLPHREFRCSLNYGHPFVAYVPPDRLREVLEDLTSLIADFDRTMGAPSRD